MTARFSLVCAWIALVAGGCATKKITCPSGFLVSGDYCICPTGQHAEQTTLGPLCMPDAPENDAEALLYAQQLAGPDASPTDLILLADNYTFPRDAKLLSGLASPRGDIWRVIDSGKRILTVTAKGTTIVDMPSGETAVVIRRGETAHTPIAAAVTDKNGIPVVRTHHRKTGEAAYAIKGLVSDTRMLLRVPPERLYGLAE